MAHCRLFSATGGLADTVTNSTSESIKVRTATGFVFQKPKQMIYEVLSACLCLVAKQRVWAMVRNNAMAQDFSWKNAAAQYEQLYLSILNS